MVKICVTFDKKYLELSEKSRIFAAHNTII